MGSSAPVLVVVLMVLVMKVGCVVFTKEAEKQPILVVDSSNPAWNNIIDLFFSYSRQNMNRKGYNNLTLNDVYYPIDKKLDFLRLRGNFTAEGGWLVDPTTIRRVEDVTTTREGTAFKMATTVTWDDIRLGYNHYRLHLGPVMEGKLEARIKSNALRAVVSFDVVDGECVTKVDELKIIEMSDFEVKITGLGWLNFLAEQIVSWILQSRRDEISSKIEQFFTLSAPEHLEGFQCDEYANLLMLSA